MNKNELNSRPFVGIVKSVAKDKGYGFIMIAYQKDMYFRLKECNIKGITQNTYVAFRKRISPRTNRIEAYDIRRISEYTKELLEIESQLLVSEKKLLYYCNKNLFEKVVEERTVNDVTALNNIDAYIENFNIKETIDSYSITVKEGHIYKPGDDDTGYVDYVGSRTLGIYIYREGVFPRCEWQRDVYIDKILPEYSENIFHERAFCPWSDILAGFGDLTEYHNKAIEKTKIAREKATTLYNKDEHKQCLIEFLNNKIKDKIADYNNNLERSLQDSLSYCFHLNIKLQEMKY